MRTSGGGLLWAAVFAGLLTVTVPAEAFVTPEAYRDVKVSLPADAVVPLDATVTDEGGRSRSLRELLGRPTIFLFADYTCTTLCGPIVAFVAAALERSGLRAGEQFGLVVVGLDPKDSTTEAARLRRDHLGGNAALSEASAFVIANQPTIERLTKAVGYRYSYDAEHDQFVHPGAAYVLRGDGHVARVLTGLGLSAADIRLAVVEASEGRVGTLGDEVRLLCSGFDPAHGTYNVLISRVLAASGAATVLVLGGGVGLLLLFGRRRAA